MQKKLSVQDLDLKGKKALIRVDFNVPLENGQITDDTRIRSSLPTIKYVLDQGGAVILMSHLGRPKGTPDSQFSLAPCAKHLSQLLNQPVQMASDSIGPEIEKKAQALKPGEILLLENLRFHKGEEKLGEEPHFAEALAKLGDLYIDDAFGCVHRPHASITAITKFFPDQAATGFLLEKEMNYLGAHLQNPNHPFYAILGGAKISTKFKIIQTLLKKGDKLLIGGAMANTFFKAKGYEIGHSLYEEDFISIAKQILQDSSQSHCKVILPVDVVITKQIDQNAKSQVVRIEAGVPSDYQIVDIGPQTVDLFQQELKGASTVFWNGPLGVFECSPFAKGTRQIASILAQLDKSITIVGGGDSIAAINETGLSDRISHLSTGGGAALEYIELGTLPGIEALSEAKPTKNKGIMKIK